MSKFKDGDKVVPISKSCYGSLEDSMVWRESRERGYMYVIEHDSEEGIYLCSSSPGESGDFFLGFDLVLYERPGKEDGERCVDVSDVSLSDFMEALEAVQQVWEVDMSMTIAEFMKRIKK